jgi:hypothetical protein
MPILQEHLSDRKDSMEKSTFSETTLASTQPYPSRHHRNATSASQFVTILEKNRNERLEHTQSVSMGTGPRRVDASARMAGEFRFEWSRPIHG